MRVNVSHVNTKKREDGQINMANISAKEVAALRKKTGCGMMECKKALVEADGDMDAAIKVLRERGLAVAAKKADRIAAEGIVDILTEDNATAIIEVNSETDFVAKNETFQTFVKNLLKVILKNRPADLDALNACAYPDSDMTVDEKVKDMIFTIGENMHIRRFQVIDGVVSTYIHGKGSIGVVVTFDTDADTAGKDAFKEMAKNVALQVAAMPVLYLNKEAVPASVLEEEKSVLMSQIKNDPKMASKPEQIIEKMVLGRIGKYYEQNCLMEQEYVKDDKVTVGQYVQNTAKELGAQVKVTGFVRYERGEGLEKREDNFAEEIAKMVNG